MNHRQGSSLRRRRVRGEVVRLQARMGFTPSASKGWDEIHPLVPSGCIIFSLFINFRRLEPSTRRPFIRDDPILTHFILLHTVDVRTRMHMGKNLHIFFLTARVAGGRQRA